MLSPIATLSDRIRDLAWREDYGRRTLAVHRGACRWCRGEGEPGSPGVLYCDRAMVVVETIDEIVRLRARLEQIEKEEACSG